MGYPKFLIENEFLFNAAVFLGQQVKKVLAPFQIASYLKKHTVKKVQIGSGKHNLAGWLNMDILPFPGIVYINVLKRLPFEDGTFDYVFSEHVISIFTYEQALGWMSECRRILKPGGKIRIATSDLGFLIDLYRKDKTDVQKRYIRFAVDKFCRLKIQEDTVVINNFVRAWGNKFIYDFKMLEMLLRSAGFEKVEKREVGQSGDEHLKNLEWHGEAIGDDFNKLETFVVEASRP